MKKSELPVCPCDNCKKKNNCPAVCYVKLDYLGALRKRGKSRK